jgi:hypothetical protein
MAGLPETVTQLSHALVIKASGVAIGCINEWAPKQTRTITELYEFGQITGPYSQLPGEPYEKVPGNISGMTMDVQRYDIYTRQMELAFGTPDLTMLSNQSVAFEVREQWLSPGGTDNYAMLYRGCWFSDVGRTLSSTGDRLVNVRATLHYTRKERVPF